MAARLPLLVAAAARPPSAAPAPMAAITPPTPARVAAPTPRPVMARPEAAPVVPVVVVPPSVKTGKPKPEPMVPPLIREYVAGIEQAMVAATTAIFIIMLIIFEFGVGPS